MKAIVVRTPGPPDALELTQIPTPQPGPTDVLVRAHAIGVGKPDLLLRQGTYSSMPPLPAIPGNELAGTIAAVGANVTAWTPGDRVFVSSRELDRRGGCYAEYIAVPATAPFGLPNQIDFPDAVILGNVQLAVALLATATPPDLTTDATRAGTTTALVPGAAGGVATVLCQLAAARGIRVIGTTSTDAKRQIALANGADTVFSRTRDLGEQVRAATDGRGVDVAFDHVGTHLLIECLRSLAPLGLAVSYNAIGGPPSADVFGELRALVHRSLGLRVVSMHTLDAQPQTRRALMHQAIALMQDKTVTASGLTVLPLDEARRAHEVLETRAVPGKIVLTL